MYFHINVFLGHYRVNYDDTNWIKLAEYLNSPDYEKIHVINRAQIIQDSYNMFIEKKMNLTTFLELSNYLSREVDYIVWCPIFDIFIESIEFLLETTEGSKLIKVQIFNNFNIIRFPFVFIPYLQLLFLQPYILNLMNNIIESVGFDFDDDDDYITRLTKTSVRKWACHFDHIGCVMKANTELIALLESSEESE